MNIKKQFISRFAGAVLLAAPALAALSSCGSVFDDLDPCPRGISLRFVYDYNMEKANAFPSQVGCLTLHIYDADGNFVATHTETTDALSDEGYRMTIDLPAGDYHAVAYGGIECQDASFAHNVPPVSGTRYTDIAMAIKPAHIGTRLHDLFHGAIDFTVEEGLDYSQATVRMMKDTNHFRIMLQHMSYDPVDGKDFEFKIVDDNTLFAHDNSLLDNGETTYTAWTVGQVSTGHVPAEIQGNKAHAADNPVEVKVGYAELSTSRLHLMRNPRLIIYSHEKQRNIVELPLNNYLTLSKSDADDMGDQEYLDRQSRWNMLFFLDRDHLWLKTNIVVNDWRVRINDIDDF